MVPLFLLEEDFLRLDATALDLTSLTATPAQHRDVTTKRYLPGLRMGH